MVGTPALGVNGFGRPGGLREAPAGSLSGGGQAFRPGPIAESRTSMQLSTPCPGVFYEDAKNYAVKSVLACKLARAMEAQSLSRARMAARMETSRSQHGRLLDPENEGVTLHTLKRVAAAVGIRLELELRRS